MSRRLTEERGFTLLQLLLVMAIIAILVAVMFSVSGLLRKKAERAKCAAQMRTLAVALGAYTQENKQWPQPPMSSLGSNEEKFWRWWFEVFEQPPYVHDADPQPVALSLSSACDQNGSTAEHDPS